MSEEIQSEIVRVVGEIPGVFAMPVEDDDILCCVKITVERREKIDSGSMQFHHLRYLTFGQMVWIRIRDNEEQPRFDDSGAIAFTVKNTHQAVEYISQISDYIPHEKEDSETGVLIKEVV